MKLRSEIKIGIIVALGIAILIWGVPFLKGRDIFSKYKKIYVIYENVDGLAESNQVLVNGFQIGQVEKINFLPDNSGRLLVTLKVEGKIFVPKQSIARISGDLLGAKTIRIIFSKDTKEIENKDTLVGQVETSFTSELSEQLGPVRTKAEALIQSMDSVLKTVQLVLNKNTREDLMATIANLKNTMGSFQGAAGKMDSFVGSEQTRLSSIFKNVESISSNLANNGKQIDNIIHNFSNISDSLSKAKISSTIYNANATLSKMNDLMSEISTGKGTIGQLIHNDSLYTGLNNSARDLDKLMVDLKEHPGRYVRFSIFGGSKK